MALVNQYEKVAINFNDLLCCVMSSMYSLFLSCSSMEIGSIYSTYVSMKTLVIAGCGRLAGIVSEAVVKGL
jgi:hypothetical protein